VRINNVIEKILPELLKKVDLIHITGKKDFAKFNYLRSRLENFSQNYTVYSFSKEVANLINKADLIISRAGANTLAEISFLGKASILIPLKGSANNHQFYNALYYQERKAALVINEDQLSPDELQQAIFNILENEFLRRDLAKNSALLGQRDSLNKIAKEILEFLK